MPIAPLRRSVPPWIRRGSGRKWQRRFPEQICPFQVPFQDSEDGEASKGIFSTLVASCGQKDSFHYHCMIPHNPAAASVLHRSLFQGAIRPDGNKHDAECCVSGQLGSRRVLHVAMASASGHLSLFVVGNPASHRARRIRVGGECPIPD